LKLRGVLFDAGDTLIRPVGGRWNPRLDFEAVLARHEPGVSPELFAAAFAEGERFLADASSTPPRDEYHRAVLRVLGVAEPSAALLSELERPLEVPVVEPFSEVREVLEGLRSLGVRMSVVSDNWAGIEGLFEQLGLHAYFDAFVVSAELGSRKPDPRMYRAGSDGLGLAPEECVFVDDDPQLVTAAIQLGYEGRVIAREGAKPPDSVPRVASLTELLGLFDSR
jgi:putative hydrolase of the HAD superfamily